MRRCVAFSLATCLTASVFGVTSVSASVATGPTSTYMVVLDEDALYSRSSTLSAASFEDWQDDNFGDDLDDPSPNNDTVTSPDHEVDERPVDAPSSPPSTTLPVATSPTTTAPVIVAPPANDHLVGTTSDAQAASPTAVTASSETVVVRSATLPAHRAHRVVSVKRKGTRLVVTVAPTSSTVRVLRAGRVIATGVGTTFVVPRGVGSITAQVALSAAAAGGR